MIDEKLKVTTDENKNLLTMFKNLIINLGNGNVEVAASRDKCDYLPTRLNNFDSSLEQKAKQIDLEVERNRINNLTKVEQGSATGDAELIDARVSVNGEVYDNVGESIRTQISKIAAFSVNLYEFGGYGLYEENGINNTSQSYWYCKPIKCAVGDEIKINKRVSWASSWIAILDKNGALI